MNYRFDLTLPVEAEFRRIAGEEIDAIETLLRDAPEGRQRAVHGARKGLKRLRGLLKLIKEGNPDFAGSENERLGNISRNLSVARDADALIEALDRLSDHSLKRKDVMRIGPIRAYLEQRRDRIVHEQMESATVIHEVLEGLKDSRASFDSASLSGESLELLANGYDRMLAKARKSMKKAGSKREAEAFHDMRKALKHHWMHLQLLEDMPGVLPARKKRAERLGNKLGQLNDIYNMFEVLDREGGEIAEPEAERLLRKALRKRESSLRKNSLKLAQELLGKRSKLAKSAQKSESPFEEPDA